MLPYALTAAAVPILAIVALVILYRTALSKADSKDIPAIMESLAAALFALFHWRR